MSTVIGPSFPSEMAAAGVVNPPISWSSEGINYGDFVQLDGTVIKNPNLTDQMRSVIAAVLNAHDPHTPWPPESLDEIKAVQKTKINDSASAVINAAIADYPDFERLTWSTQQAESVLWEAAAEADRLPDLVPWCANAAANRTAPGGGPMALADFMALVHGNVEAYMALSSTVAGKRQTYRDQIDAAENRQAVEAIVWQA